MKFFLVVILTALPTMAQTQNYPEVGKEFQLLPLDDLAQRMVPQRNATSCGKYFHMAGKDPGPDAEGKYPVVVFNFFRDNSPNLMLMATDKFVVMVDRTKAVPTVSFSDKPGPSAVANWHWILRMSENDAKAFKPCVPRARVRV